MTTPLRPPLDRLPAPAYRTAGGACWCADALRILQLLPAASVQLVLTSPPFPLRREKAYGNVTSDAYPDWFMPFAEQIHRVLTDDGSFVLELGGAWERGQATRSLYHYRLVLKLCEAKPGFHLAQDFYCHNSAKLPGPAEWVTKQRTRVKDAVSYVWWLSKSPTPAADNRRVAQPYSRSMLRLLRDGHKPATRPSQHKIGDTFHDRGGAIPSNLLTVPNTFGSDPYIARCRAAGHALHPARFAPAVPEFFVKLCTKPGQVVLDPFAGSNTTGHVAEQLGRRWLAIELNADYVAASRLRFTGEKTRKARA